MAEKKNIATGLIGNALRSSAADHTTTFTDEVFDTERQKYQSEVNTDIERKIETEAEARDLAINAEAQARTQNDQLLSQAIAAEQERAEAAEQANATAINTQDQKLSELEGEIYDIAEWVDGYVISGGIVKNASVGDSVSKPIRLSNGQNVIFTTNGDKTFFFDAICKVDSNFIIDDGSAIVESLAKKTTGNTVETFTYIATEDCYIVLCGRKDNNRKFRLNENGNSISNISNKQDKLISGQNIKTIDGESLLGSGDIKLPTIDIVNNLQGGGSTSALSAEQGKVIGKELFLEDIPIIEWVDGFVIDDLYIKPLSVDKVSKPIFIKKGVTLKFSTEGDGYYFFTTIAYATSNTSIVEGSTLQSKIAYRASGRDLESYTFTAENDCYVVLCGRILDTTSVDFEGYEKISKIEEIEKHLTGIEPINKSYDLLAFNSIAYLDGTNWKVNNLTNYNGIAIPVVYGQMFVFVGGENNTDYAFVKSIGTSAVPVDFATLKSKVSLKANETRVVAVPSDAKYLYITKTSAGIDKLPVSVFSTFSTAELGNPLFGKKLSVNGDSICGGAGFYGGYAKLIAENNCMEVQNIAIGGGTIAADTYTSNEVARHWICRTMQNLDNDADYYIIEGGVNDSSLNVTLGSLSSELNSSIDDKTFYGAMESICRYLMLNCQGKKVGFIIVHQMTAGMQPNGDYYNAEIDCLTKYGIPFLDLSKQVPPFGIAGFDVDMKTTYTYNGDGWHPNEEGYKKYYVPKIEAWMKTL